MSKLSKAGLAVALTLVLGATLLAPANTPAHANGTPIIDVAGEELSFSNPDPDVPVGPGAVPTDSFQYKGVATVGTHRIDAEVTVNRVEGVVTEVGGEDDCKDEDFAIDFLDNESGSRDEALLTRLEVCPSSTGYIEYSVAFFRTTTDDENFATDEVILKNLSVTFTDADLNEFMMVYGAKGYRLTEETTVTAQTIGSNVLFQAASDGLSGDDSDTKGQAEATFANSQEITIGLGRSNGSDTKLRSNVYEVFFRAGAGATFQPEVTVSSLGACTSGDTSSYAGGSGTPADPYEIATKEQLILLSESSGDWAASFKQTAHISLDGCNFTPIGNSATAFTGDYDGGGYRVEDLNVQVSSGSAGFFGVAQGAQIESLQIVDVRVSSSATDGSPTTGAAIGSADANTSVDEVQVIRGSVSGYLAGGLVGLNAGSITASSSSADVSWVLAFLGSRVGGLVGDNDGTIEGSRAEGEVSGYEDVGGFVGINDGTISASSSATGDATAAGDRAGGFVGLNAGTIRNSSASGDATAGNDQAGGFVGLNAGTIRNSSASGDATAGDDQAGGFVGDNDGTISDSTASGDATAGDLADGVSPKVDRGSDDVGGFAGLNDSDGTITNSTASGSARAEGDNAGGFVGENEGTISGSSATGNAAAAGDRAGGFVAWNDQEDGQRTISNSFATGDASAGGARVGGFVGQNELTIESSWASGDAFAGVDKAGGFVGDNWSAGVIRDSYATGSAEAKVEEAGGFAGDSGGTISRSYSIGTAKARSGVGGFLGKDDGTTEDSFWDITTSGLTDSDGGLGDNTDQATGKTTAEMKSIVTYNDTATVGLATAWAIVPASAFGVPDGTSTEIWGIGSGVNCGYPFLHWQDQSGHVCVLPDSGSGNSGRNDDDDDGDTVAAVVTPAPSAAGTARSRVADATTRQPVAGPVLRGGVVSAPPRVPTVLVGGVPTIVEESSPDPTTLSVLAGSLSVDVSVDEGSGEVSRLDDGSNRLSVKSGSAAALRGSGLQPGARVQVFIPLGVDDSRELANVTVAADGTFSGELPVPTDPLAEPLPIGERLLQLVSVDADGNQVVFEMAVNVTQADSAPALDREAGGIPVVGLGASAVTSAGVVTAATMTALADQGLAIVEGDTWNMTIAIDSEQGGVESTDSGALVTLVRNEAAQVSGVGFMAGTRADVWLFSEPVLLGTVTVDENGDFSGEVGIDSELIPTGEHTLQLQGVGQDGYVKAATMGVSVNDAQPELAAAEQAGLDLGFIWWILAIIVLVAIVVALWLRRNRRA